jgi:hypothetical protein
MTDPIKISDVAIDRGDPVGGRSAHGMISGQVASTLIGTEATRVINTERVEYHLPDTRSSQVKGDGHVNQTIDQMREILEPDADEYKVSKEMLQAWLEEVERLRREENKAKEDKEKSLSKMEARIIVNKMKQLVELCFYRNKDQVETVEEMIEVLKGRD